jgi:ribosomal protein S18 acetylase RimI-like enzyme
MSQENVEALGIRQRRSQRAFYRAIAGGSPRAELLGIDGVQATLVPVREWFSIFNSVFYDQPDELARAYPELAARYAALGVKAWTVWVPPNDSQAGSILQGRGHVLDSTPMLFAASISSLDIEPKMKLDIDPNATWELVGKINDRAHGVLDEWSMAAVFETMNDPESHLHIARLNGAPVSALIAREHDGDCYFWFVATAPEAQGRGIASELMRHALRGAVQRGCTTSSLESTKVAEAMYEHLGYKPFGRYEMWEWRTE